MFSDLDARSVWAALSYSNRLFLLFFCGVSFYTLRLSFNVMLRLRSLQKQPGSCTETTGSSNVRHFRSRLENLRQLHLLTLYVLWLCIVINIPEAFSIFGEHKTFPVGPILYKLAFLFYYYTPFFVAFVLLHSVQWFISSRVDVFKSRESANLTGA